MLRVVVDARHHVRAAEALRVFERRVGDQFAGFEVDQAQDDGRRAEVHRDAVDRPGGARDLDAVDEDAIAVARDGRIERHRLRGSWADPSACRSMRIWPRRIVWHLTSPASATIGHWQERRKLPLRCRSCSVGGESSSMPAVTSTMHSLHLPFLRQDVGTCTPSRSAQSKSDCPASGVDPSSVDRQGRAASATVLPVGLRLQLGLRRRRRPPARRPPRSCSSLHFHCAR